MSEFTSGLLFLSRAISQVKPLLPSNPDSYFLEPLNDKWTGLYLADAWLQQPATLQLVLDISQHVPLLYFQNAEDHGWGYRVFCEGREVASFYNNYMLEREIKLWMPIAKKRFAQDDESEIQFILFGSDTWDLQEIFFAEVRQTDEYRHLFEQQFRNTHTHTFALFEIAPEAITRIDRLLSMESFHTEAWTTVDVEQFKEAVGIMEMEWKGYRYARKRRRVQPLTA